MRLWDAETGVHKRTLTGPTGPVLSLVFSPDGTTLASGSASIFGIEEGTVRLWDAETGVHKRDLTGHTDWVWHVVFSPDGRVLASGSRDKTVRLWDAVTGEHKRDAHWAYGKMSVA